MATEMMVNRDTESLLREATNEQAAAKVAAFGDPGSGKTVTMALLALGISKEYCNSAPVAVYDTELASDFIGPIFRSEGVKLLVRKGRAFAELVPLLAEAERAGCCAFIIDQVSHLWEELVNSYCAKQGIRGMPQFHHWKDIKAPWKIWTDRYLTSPLHIFCIGRLGWEYEYQHNEETNKQELIKGESKMRAEGQFGYEPHLLIEMERERQAHGAQGGRINHIAHVLKDRAWALNGARIEFPDTDQYSQGYYRMVLDAFRPHLESLNLGGAQQSVEGHTSEGLFAPNGTSEYTERDRRRTVALEEIEAAMVVLWPSQDIHSKQLKIRVVETLFGTRSWSAVTRMPTESVEEGSKTLKEYERRAKGAEGVDTPEGALALLEKIKSERTPGPVRARIPHNDTPQIPEKAFTAPAGRQGVPPATRNGTISEKQAKRAFAIASENGWRDNEVDALLQAFGLAKMEELQKGHQYEEFIRKLEAGA